MSTLQRFLLESEMLMERPALERINAGMLFGSNEPKNYELSPDGVAVVSIDGPLMQRGGFWFDGYAAISKRVTSALAAPEVRSVVLRINSPGGVCAGCFSAARELRAAKEHAGKPVIAFADEHAYSAAYAVACIADEIYVPREGGVGSIGVIGCLVDWSALNAKIGINVAVLVSGSQKADGHPDVPMTKAAIDRAQKRIDQLAESFFELVGTARSMSTGAVRALEAGCFYGSDAVSKGLANGVATLSEVIGIARTKSATPRSSMQPARAERAEHHEPTPAAAPAERQEQSMTTKSEKSSSSTDVVLTADDEKTIKSLHLDRDKFIAMRRAELATKARVAGDDTPAAAPAKPSVVFTKDDEESAHMVARMSGISVDEARKQVLATKERDANARARAAG